METKTIELGGKLYEIRLVEPQPQQETKPTLPTLQEVFNKVQPKWWITGANEIIYDIYKEDDEAYHSQLFTERQCKRIQALIALQNIADYYNGEVDYRGAGYVVNRCINGEYRIVFIAHSDNFTPKFNLEDHALLAIEILRNANLLDNL